jgi:hypothetical protein
LKVSTFHGFRLCFVQMRVAASLLILDRSAMGALEDGALALGDLGRSARWTAVAPV